MAAGVIPQPPLQNFRDWVRWRQTLGGRIPGGGSQWARGESALWKHAVAEYYGENGGPCGLFHSLRVIPPILEICQKIVDIAPDATVFNYSNPMSRICTTVHRKFPNLNFLS